MKRLDTRTLKTIKTLVSELQIPEDKMTTEEIDQANFYMTEILIKLQDMYANIFRIENRGKF